MPSLCRLTFSINNALTCSSCILFLSDRSRICFRSFSISLSRPSLSSLTDSRNVAKISSWSLLTRLTEKDIGVKIGFYLNTDRLTIRLGDGKLSCLRLVLDFQFCVVLLQDIQGIHRLVQPLSESNGRFRASIMSVTTEDLWYKITYPSP